MADTDFDFDTDTDFDFDEIFPTLGYRKICTHRDRDRYRNRDRIL